MMDENNELTEQEQEEQLEREIAEEEAQEQQEPEEEKQEEPEAETQEQEEEQQEEQPQEAPKKKKKKRLEHVNDFISSAQPLYNLSNIQVSGFRALMAGREYQYDVEVFKEELKRYLGK